AGVPAPAQACRAAGTWALRRPARAAEIPPREHPSSRRACGATSARGNRRSRAPLLAELAFLALERFRPLALLRLRPIIRLDPCAHPCRELGPRGNALDALVGVHPSRRLVVRQGREERIRLAARLVHAQRDEDARRLARYVEAVALGLVAKE